MKRQLILSITIIFIFSNILSGQNEDFLIRSNRAEAQKLLEVLKSENHASQEFQKSLERTISNFISYHFYAPKVANELFDLVLNNKSIKKDDYYRFLLLNAEYFSETQLEFVKTDLPRVLDKSDFQFYDIVSIYRLDNYKALVASEVDKNYFRKLRNDFSSKNIAIAYLWNEAISVITLANLGEVSMEDSIISIVKEFHTLCQTTTDTSSKKIHYKDLYLGIVPQILGRLNSKRSLEQTLYLMLDDYIISYGENRTAVFEPYVTYVVSPKVSRPDQSMIQYNLASTWNQELPSKTFLSNLNIQVINNKLSWKKTLNDVSQ